jgi:hypothetical protein
MPNRPRDVPELNANVLDMVQVRYGGDDDTFQVDVPGDLIEDILGPFDGRRRAFLTALLNGRSRRAAAARIGVSIRCTQLWAQKDPDFAAAVEACDGIGFGAVIEDRLYKRALDRSDPGSARCLEMVVKARDPRYRALCPSCGGTTARREVRS